MTNTGDDQPDLRMRELAQELDNILKDLDNLNRETGEHAHRLRYKDSLRLVGKERAILRAMEEIDPSHKRPETRKALEQVAQQLRDFEELYKVKVRPKVKLSSDTPPGPGDPDLDLKAEKLS